MKYYQIHPQVDGHFGRNTVFIDESARPIQIEKLHMELDSFTGDDIITSIGIYVVTDQLAGILQSAVPKISGISFADVEISKSDEYYWNQTKGYDYAPEQLPKFVWLKVSGEAGVDDFAKPSKGHLVVSERALHVLQSFNLEHCKIKEFAT